MLYPWLAPLLAAIACIALSFFVLTRGPRNELARVSAMLSLVLTSFNLFYFILYYVEDYWTAFYWARVFRVGSFLTTPVSVHLAVALRTRRSMAWDVILAVNYAIATLFVLGNLFDLFVDGLVEIPWGYTTHRRPLYEVLTIYTLVNGILAMGLVVYQYQTATDARTRLQSKFWMLGLITGVTFGLTNFLPAYDIPIYPLGYFGSVAFAGIIAYAIVRHRLMGVEVAVTKGIAYAAVVALILSPGFMATVWMQRAAFGRVDYEFSFGTLVILVLVGVAFPTARRWVEGRVERSLFRESRESRAAIASFAKDTVKIIEEDQLVAQLCETVWRVFHLDRVSLFSLDDSRGEYRLRKSLGTLPIDDSLDSGHALCRWLSDCAEPVLRDEAEQAGARAEAANILDFLDRNGWKVCVPLVGSERMNGFLVLGKKPNLNAYVREDLEVLGVLGAEATIAFENARLYDELRRSHDIIGRAGRLSALGTFAAGIAHEVRNPLVSIQTFFQLAPERHHDEEFMTNFLPLAEQELVRIRNLISELLSFARSPAAKVQRVAMSDVISRSMTLLSPHARKERVEIVTKVGDVPDEVDADPDQLMQVLVNIVLNAVQASPEEGVVEISLSEAIRDGRPVVRTTVVDQGPGIPLDVRESVFNPFYTTKDKGTGLGLSIVHRIVVDSGGTINVEDNGQSGACFAIEFPIAGSTVNEIEENESRPLPRAS